MIFVDNFPTDLNSSIMFPHNIEYLDEWANLENTSFIHRLFLPFQVVRQLLALPFGTMHQLHGINVGIAQLSSTIIQHQLTTGVESPQQKRNLRKKLRQRESFSVDPTASTVQQHVD